MSIDLSKLELKIYPDPILKSKCHDVDPNDPDLPAVIDKMVAIMFMYEGQGLSAPQVGLDWNLFIVSLGPKQEPRALVNPKILRYGEVLCHSKEGCLSVPGIVGKIHTRSETLDISTYVRGRIEPVELKLMGAEAIVFAHEMDHLNGLTIFDRMSQLDRSLAKKKYKKIKNKQALLDESKQYITLNKEMLQKMASQLVKKAEDKNEQSHQEPVSGVGSESGGAGGCDVESAAGAADGVSEGHPSV